MKSIKDLRSGAVFRTENGILALKTEYHTFDNCSRPDCYLLESGESAVFTDDTPAEEVPLALIRNAVELFGAAMDLLALVLEKPEHLKCEVSGCEFAAEWEGWYRVTDFSLNPTGLIQKRQVCELHKGMLIGEKE